MEKDCEIEWDRRRDIKGRLTFIMNIKLVPGDDFEDLSFG